MTVKILTDSTSYIPDDIRRELGIRRVSLSLVFPGEPSVREVDIDYATFYEKMALKGIPTSSQPSVGEMVAEMQPVITAGDALCGVFISSDMSGTYANAEAARQLILEHHPEAQIAIIDSRANCMQLGFCAIAAARAAQTGGTLAQVAAAALDNIRKSRFLFIPATLEYLIKGGRIGRASALVANLLKIVPVLTIENGFTTTLAKVRTRAGAFTAMLDRFSHDVAEFGLGEVVVHHINVPAEAKALAAEVAERVKTAVPIVDIGPVVGLHVGPGSLGVAYYTQQPMR